MSSRELSAREKVGRRVEVELTVERDGREHRLLIAADVTPGVPATRDDPATVPEVELTGVVAPPDWSLAGLTCDERERAWAAACEAVTDGESNDGPDPDEWWNERQEGR